MYSQLILTGHVNVEFVIFGEDMLSWFSCCFCFCTGTCASTFGCFESCFFFQWQHLPHLREGRGVVGVEASVFFVHSVLGSTFNLTLRVSLPFVSLLPCCGTSCTCWSCSGLPQASFLDPAGRFSAEQRTENKNIGQFCIISLLWENNKY